MNQVRLVSIRGHLYPAVPLMVFVQEPRWEPILNSF